jgi:hypothetical protein
MMDVLKHRNGNFDRVDLGASERADFEDRGSIEEEPRMESDLVVNGAIVDSWIESSREIDDSPRLVLQVAPKGRPRDLIFVEAEASLIPDEGWYEDLSENTCHGSPVLAIGRRMLNGFITATCLQLVR